MDQIKRDFTHQTSFAESSNQSPAFRDHNDNTQGWWEIQRQAMMPQPDPVAQRQFQQHGHPQFTGQHPEAPFASQPEATKFGDVWGRGASLASHLSNDFFYQQNPAVQRYARQYGQGGVSGFHQAHSEMTGTGAGGGQMGRYGMVRESAQEEVEVEEERIPLHLREADPYYREGVGGVFKMAARAGSAIARAAKPHLNDAAAIGRMGASKVANSAPAKAATAVASAVKSAAKPHMNDAAAIGRMSAHHAGKAASGAGGAVKSAVSSHPVVATGVALGTAKAAHGVAKQKSGSGGSRDGDGDGILNESSQPNRVPMHLREAMASYESYERKGSLE